MKDLTRLFALLLMAGALLTLNACSDDDPAVEPEPKTTAELLVGDWIMEPVAGAFAVGPAEGSAEWFFNDTESITTRACFFNDVYTFGADGSFSMTLGAETWLETWQGVAEGCGAPIAPHDGSGSYTFTADETSITIQGAGGFLGLAKAINGAELPNAAVPSSRTYKILSFDGESTPKKLKLGIVAGDPVNWTFNFISQ